MNISDFEITVQKVIIDKTYDEIELEASQYFKTEWIQKGSLSNYNSENMSLVYVYIKVKNIASNTAECPIGMASIGNYYDDNKYYRLSECAAIYPSSYERTTHCLYDDINAGEEKVYIRDKDDWNEIFEDISTAWEVANLSDEEAEKKVDSLDWKKGIIVYIESDVG